MPSSPSPSATSSYWCHRCTRSVTVWPQDSLICPDCEGGFLEQIPRQNSLPDNNSRRNRSSFNPVIVLRVPSENRPQTRNFEFYYDDGESPGLLPLPPSMSGFLMGSGLERLLDQLAQIEVNGICAGPASKEAIQSMPTIEVADSHDCNCVVCMEPFDVGGEAKEMPCKHIFHEECILPWLSKRNSCPVCRHEMPVDDESERERRTGLTIWRLPGGGFAVGRFRIGDRRQIPAVYTEMDGGFGSGGVVRRVSWGSRGDGSRRRGGVGRFFRNVFSLLGGHRSA